MSAGPVIAIVGPTASGKSDVAVELALMLNGEVIGADSVQIYRHMDIGSGKITHEEMRGVPHHMIDCVEPTESYNVAMYRRDADKCLQDIRSRGHIPIICGGTGLYVDALLFPMGFSAGYDPEIRKRWESYCDEHGPDQLFEALMRVDPETASRTDRNNIKRVIRALEIFDITGRPMSSQRDETYTAREYRYPETRVYGILWERQVLNERIRRRVHAMMLNGLEKETRALLSMGCTADSQSMQALGYREMTRYIEQGTPESTEMLESDIWIHTRQFAKRQMTWFRRDTGTTWIPGGNAREIAESICKGLGQFSG